MNTAKRLEKAEEALESARARHGAATQERDEAVRALAELEETAAQRAAEGDTELPDLTEPRRRIESAETALRVYVAAVSKAEETLAAAKRADEAERQERGEAEYRAMARTLEAALEVALQRSNSLRAIRARLPRPESVPELAWRELGGEGSRLHAWRKTAHDFLEPPAPRPVQGVKVRMLVTNRDRRFPFRERNEGEVRTLSEADAERLVAAGVAERVVA
jgi:DNA repair exonuclease SbcCD ATPase subunit